MDNTNILAYFQKNIFLVAVNRQVPGSNSELTIVRPTKQRQKFVYPLYRVW